MTDKSAHLEALILLKRRADAQRLAFRVIPADDWLDGINRLAHRVLTPTEERPAVRHDGIGL